MTLKFYPCKAELQGTLADRVKILIQAANNFKKIVYTSIVKPTVPREINASYNWQELARVLTEIRNLPENDMDEKQFKSKLLLELANLYSVLSEAKMSKLEAVRLALLGEVKTVVRGV